MMLKKYLWAGVFCVLWMAGICHAQNQDVPQTAKQLADDIAPLITENTVCVIHIDFTKLDVKQIFDSYNAMQNIVRESVPQDSLQDALPGIVSIMPFAGKEVSEASCKEAAVRLFRLFGDLRNKYHVSDAYYIATLDDYPVAACIAVPVRKETKIKGELSESLPFVEKKGFMILADPRASFDAGQNRHAFVERMFGKNVVFAKRPEIEAAFSLTEQQPVQAVAFLPVYAKKLIAQTMPQLPSPLDNVPSEVVMDGVQFVSIGFDPNHFTGSLTIHSKDQNAAEKLHELVTNLPEMIDTGTSEFGDVPFLEKYARLIGSIVQKNGDFIFPKPAHGKITVTLNGVQSKDAIQKLIRTVAQEIGGGPIGDQYAKNRCTNNIKAIMLAMHNYHDSNNCFPPVYTVDADNKPLHSWRVALLRYLDPNKSEFYKKIRLNEPWDSEWNKQFHDQCPDAFQCPTMTADEKKAGMTAYSFVVGKDTYPMTSKRPFGLIHITDGSSNTVCVVECKTPVCWMCPDQGLKQEDVFRGVTGDQSVIGLRHNNSFNTGYFDGSVRNIKTDITNDVWKAILTIAGGESKQY